MPIGSAVVRSGDGGSIIVVSVRIRGIVVGKVKLGQLSNECILVVSTAHGLVDIVYDCFGNDHIGIGHSSLWIGRYFDGRLRLVCDGGIDDRVFVGGDDR